MVPRHPGGPGARSQGIRAIPEHVVDLNTRRAEFILRDVHHQYPRPKILKFVPIPLSSDVEGLTLENNIYLRPGAYDPSTADGLALLGHELVHVGQYQRDGLNRLSYIRELLRHGSGRENKFENPAYDKGDQIRRDLPTKGRYGCPQ